MALKFQAGEVELPAQAIGFKYDGDPETYWLAGDYFFRAEARCAAKAAASTLSVGRLVDDGGRGAGYVAHCSVCLEGSKHQTLRDLASRHGVALRPLNRAARRGIA